MQKYVIKKGIVYVNNDYSLILKVVLVYKLVIYMYRKGREMVNLI